MTAILQDRGVSDIDNFLRPSPECELDPFDLENIEAAAEMLMKHLRADSRILFIVDADTDGHDDERARVACWRVRVRGRSWHRAAPLLQASRR